jgi:hypothetical protein
MDNYNFIWVCREAVKSDYFDSRLMICWKRPPIWDEDLQCWLKDNEGEMITIVPTQFPDIKVGECEEFKV